MENKKKLLQIIRVALLLVLIVCLVKISQTYYLSYKHKKQQEELSIVLQNEKYNHEFEQIDQQNIEEQNNEDISDKSSEVYIQIQEPEVMDQYKALYEKNNDMIGWLSIDGTIIDYPVMQNEDNEYYLHHNFYKEEDRYGCLYVKDIADVDTPGTNFIIYGHNMKDGSMFGILDNYWEQSFYEEHPLIHFDTLYEERIYEIIAVFPSQVYRKDEDVFKYYQFYQANTEEEFLSFYENVMAMALYETGVTAEFGDTFLMLSTCAYHVEDGRFVVLAKKM